VAVPGTFGYRGRGYDHPDAERVAELLFEMERTFAAERCAAAKSSVLPSDFEAAP
jgi:hypothetical protein